MYDPDPNKTMAFKKAITSSLWCFLNENDLRIQEIGAATAFAAYLRKNAVNFLHGMDRLEADRELLQNARPNEAGADNDPVQPD